MDSPSKNTSDIVLRGVPELQGIVQLPRSARDTIVTVFDQIKKKQNYIDNMWQSVAPREQGASSGASKRGLRPVCAC